MRRMGGCGVLSRDMVVVLLVVGGTSCQCGICQMPHSFHSWTIAAANDFPRLAAVVGVVAVARHRAEGARPEGPATVLRVPHPGVGEATGRIAAPGARDGDPGGLAAQLLAGERVALQDTHRVVLLPLMGLGVGYSASSCSASSCSAARISRYERRSERVNPVPVARSRFS